jgi:ATP-dependent DNA ligase
MSLPGKIHSENVRPRASLRRGVVLLVPPVPPMLAAPVDRLPVGALAYEPKWDGWRVLLFRDGTGVYLQSRAGKPLGQYFPELTRLARAHLPAGLVLDGELVIWEPDRDRTNFALLQRRVAAGSAVREAYRHPAHLVAFDALQVDGREILAEPLTARREALAGVLADAPPQLALCPQSTDPADAREWLADLPPLGVEGLVVKRLGGAYRPGRRGWHKLRQRQTTEAVIGGVTGPIERPDTLLLGRFDGAGRLRYAGRSRPLAVAQRAALGPALTRAGPRRGGGVNHPWPRPLPAAWSGHFDQAGPLEYRQVAPAVVAEIRVDAAYEHARWRHGVEFVRMRPDLAVTDVPFLEA